MTGKPLLANDPHLRMAAPNLWYEAHLVTGDGLNVTGVTLPGGPHVVIGHNDRVAWGYTNGFGDVQDLYLERFHPDNPHLVEYRDEWEPAQVIQEQIRVKGQVEPVVETVIVTRHGPVISGVVEGSEQGLALRWVALEQPSTIAAAVRGFNWARSWTDFREAARYFDIPGQNVVYADVDGNIGYILTGKVPIRVPGQGTTFYFSLPERA